MAVPVLEDPMSSSGFHGHQACTWCIDTYVGKISIHIMVVCMRIAPIGSDVWSSVAGIVWEGVGGVALLKEEGHWGGD